MACVSSTAPQQARGGVRGRSGVGRRQICLLGFLTDGVVSPDPDVPDRVPRPCRLEVRLHGGRSRPSVRPGALLLDPFGLGGLELLEGHAVLGREDLGIPGEPVLELWPLQQLHEEDPPRGHCTYRLRHIDLGCEAGIHHVLPDLDQVLGLMQPRPGGRQGPGCSEQERGAVPAPEHVPRVSLRPFWSHLPRLKTLGRIQDRGNRVG